MTRDELEFIVQFIVNDILKSAKNFYEKCYTKEAASKTATAEIFSKISNREKISNKQFHHCEANNF